MKRDREALKKKELEVLRVENVQLKKDLLKKNAELLELSGKIDAQVLVAKTSIVLTKGEAEFVVETIRRTSSFHDEQELWQDGCLCEEQKFGCGNFYGIDSFYDDLRNSLALLGDGAYKPLEEHSSDKDCGHECCPCLKRCDNCLEMIPKGEKLCVNCVKVQEAEEKVIYNCGNNCFATFYFIFYF